MRLLISNGTLTLAGEDIGDYKCFPVILWIYRNAQTCSGGFNDLHHVEKLVETPD